MQDSVIAFSKTSRTSENINKSIFGNKKKTTTFEDFMAMSEEQLNKLEFIIIDEIYTFTNQEIFQIKTKLENTKVKVIALGDSSQITAEKEPSLQTSFFGKGKTTLPLTTTFRTNVDAIAVFANNFRMRASIIESASARASATLDTILEKPSEALGVAITTDENILTALRQPSSRSRVLIVPTEADRNTYKSILPQVTVITPEEAQGYQ